MNRLEKQTLAQNFFWQAGVERLLIFTTGEEVQPASFYDQLVPPKSFLDQHPYIPEDRFHGYRGLVNETPLGEAHFSRLNCLLPQYQVDVAPALHLAVDEHVTSKLSHSFEVVLRMTHQEGRRDIVWRLWNQTFEASQNDPFKIGRVKLSKQIEFFRFLLNTPGSAPWLPFIPEWEFDGFLQILRWEDRETKDARIAELFLPHQRNFRRAIFHGDLSPTFRDWLFNQPFEYLRQWGQDIGKLEPKAVSLPSEVELSESITDERFPEGIWFLKRYFDIRLSPPLVKEMVGFNFGKYWEESTELETAKQFSQWIADYRREGLGGDLKPETALRELANLASRLDLSKLVSLSEREVREKLMISIASQRLKRKFESNRGNNWVGQLAERGVSLLRSKVSDFRILAQIATPRGEKPMLLVQPVNRAWYKKLTR